MSATIAIPGRLIETRVAEDDGQLAHPLRERQEHVAVAVREPEREVDPEEAQERAEVAGPGDRDRHVADRVLEDQVPADDPGHELAERRVGVRVGAAGDRDERGELRVAQPRERAHRAQQDEGDDQRGTGAVAHHGAVGRHLARGGGADGREDARPDHGPDPEHHEIEGAERALEARAAALDLGDDVGHRLGAEQRAHWGSPRRGGGAPVIGKPA